VGECAGRTKYRIVRGGKGGGHEDLTEDAQGYVNVSRRYVPVCLTVTPSHDGPCTEQSRMCSAQGVAGGKFQRKFSRATFDKNLCCKNYATQLRKCYELKC